MGTESKRDSEGIRKSTNSVQTITTFMHEKVVHFIFFLSSHILRVLTLKEQAKDS